MERAALAVVYDHGRDDELRELRRLLLLRNQEIADLRQNQAMLEQRAANTLNQREEAAWEALCQAGIRMGGRDIRQLVEIHITRSCWGITEGVIDANNARVAPGPFNFAPNERGEWLLPELTLLTILSDDFRTRNWSPFPQYLRLLSESGIFQPREGGHFRRFHMMEMPRLFDNYYETDDEGLSDGLSDGSDMIE